MEEDHGNSSIRGDPELSPVERVEKIDELYSEGWLSDSALDRAVSNLLFDIKGGYIGSSRENEKALKMLKKKVWISQISSDIDHESVSDTKVFDPSTAGSTDTEVYDILDSPDDE